MLFQKPIMLCLDSHDFFAIMFLNDAYYAPYCAHSCASWSPNGTIILKESKHTYPHIHVHVYTIITIVHFTLVAGPCACCILMQLATMLVVLISNVT